MPDSDRQHRDVDATELETFLEQRRRPNDEPAGEAGDDQGGAAAEESR